MAHVKRVIVEITLFFYPVGTNKAIRGLMKPPVPKSLNILYFIRTFTSDNFIYSLKFKKLWM